MRGCLNPNFAVLSVLPPLKIISTAIIAFKSIMIQKTEMTVMATNGFNVTIARNGKLTFII